MFELVPFGRRERDLFRELDNLEKNFFGDFGGRLHAVRTDIIDKGDKFVLSAELPGFEKSDIKIDINKDTLTIRAERNNENEEKTDTYVRRERRYGSYERSFDLTNIKSDEIAAKYENGILYVDLPKVEPKVPIEKTIEIQ
jgi:HSP20 family protein